MRYIIAIIITLLLCACGSSKKSQVEQRVVVTGKTCNAKDSSSLKVYWGLTDIIMEQEDVKIIHTVYDTSSDTAKVLSTTTYQKSRKNSKEKQKRGNLEEIREAGSATMEHSSDSTYIERVKERGETTVPKQIGRLVWAICVLVGLIIVWWIIRKFSSK